MGTGAMQCRMNALFSVLTQHLKQISRGIYIALHCPAVTPLTMHDGAQHFSAAADDEETDAAARGAANAERDAVAGLVDSLAMRPQWAFAASKCSPIPHLLCQVPRPNCWCPKGPEYDYSARP